MSFLAPGFLWGLLALAVPVIVHFFYLRRARKYEFSQAALVERLRQASRPYLRLRHWILLMLRLAIVTVIVMLFARPKVGQALPLSNQGASVVVILDVSPSMTPIFDQAKALLTKALAQDPPSYEYRLFTTDSYLPKGGFVSLRLLTERLQSVRPASMGYPIGAFLERYDLLFSEAQFPEHKVYIVSDFQRASVGDLSRLGKKVSGEIVLIPVASSLQANAYIDSVASWRTATEWKVRFRLAGETGRLYTVQIGDKTRSLLPGTYEEVLPLTATQVTLSIKGDGLDFDNLVVGGLHDPYLHRVGWSAPLGEPFLRLHRLLGITPITVRSAEDWADLAIYIGELHKLPEAVAPWVAEGGTLIAFPPQRLSTADWQKVFLAGEVLPPQERPVTRPLSLQPVASPFWEGVFVQSEKTPAYLAEPLLVPTCYQFQIPSGRPLLMDDEGMPLLWEVPIGRGRVYLFAFPWEGGRFGQHSLFVPLFARLYKWGETTESFWGAAAGKRHTFPVQMQERPRLRHLATGTEYIPPAEKKGSFWQFSFGDQPLPLGLYDITDGSRSYGTLGLNVSTEESSSLPLPPEAWTAAGIPVRVLTWEDGAISEKKRTWGWRDWHGWVLLAVLLLGAETYWARQLLKPKPITQPSL